MHAMYYAPMLRCWQLIRNLVRTNHPCLMVERHNMLHREVLMFYIRVTCMKITSICIHNG
jgi:hypothetical protein